jgi:hypothetical protein
MHFHAGTRLITANTQDPMGGQTLYPPPKGGDHTLSGSQLFWSSGTWLFMLGQGLVIVLVVGLFFYLGKKEAQARKG